MWWFIQEDFPCSSDGKESVCNAGALGSIPGSGRFSGEVNAYPLQCSCLENSTDRGAWQATVHGVAKNRTELKTYNTWKWTLLQTPAVDLRVFAGTHWSCIPAVMRTDTLFLLAVGICHDMSS